MTNSECLQSAIFGYCCTNGVFGKSTKRELMKRIKFLPKEDTSLTTFLTNGEYVTSIAQGFIRAIADILCKDCTYYQEDIEEEIRMNLWLLQYKPGKTVGKSLGFLLNSTLAYILDYLGDEQLKINFCGKDALLYSSVETPEDSFE